MRMEFDSKGTKLEITIERLKSKVEDLKKQLEETTLDLKYSEAENAKLKRALIHKESPEDEYDYSWSWISKIVFLVTQANKPLRSAEIIPKLTLRQPELNKQVSKEKFVSAFLNIAIKHKRLIPYKLKGVRGYYYCLPEWMEEEDNLVPGMRRKIY